MIDRPCEMDENLLPEGLRFDLWDSSLMRHANLFDENELHGFRTFSDLEDFDFFQTQLRTAMFVDALLLNNVSKATPLEKDEAGRR